MAKRPEARYESVKHFAEAIKAAFTAERVHESEIRRKTAEAEEHVHRSAAERSRAESMRRADDERREAESRARAESEARQLAEVQAQREANDRTRAIEKPTSRRGAAVVAVTLIAAGVMATIFYSYKGAEDQVSKAEAARIAAESRARDESEKRAKAEALARNEGDRRAKTENDAAQREANLKRETEAAAKARVEEEVRKSAEEKTKALLLKKDEEDRKRIEIAAKKEAESKAQAETDARRKIEAAESARAALLAKQEADGRAKMEAARKEAEDRANAEAKQRMEETRRSDESKRQITQPSGAPQRWDMATPYSDGEFHTINVRQFVENIKRETSGNIDITLHSNGSLLRHPDILRAVSSGQVNIAEFLLAQFGNEEPIFNTDNVPFLAAGYDNAWKLYQAQKPLLEKRLQNRGLRLLYSVAWPGQGLYTRNVVTGVGDFRGVKFRTYSAYTARFAELLGATSTVVSVPDVPQAFATGTISAMITSSATGTAIKAWEFVKNYYTTNAMHPKNVIVINERAYQRLPSAQQKILVNAAFDAERRGWELSRQRDQLANRQLAANGMAVHTPDTSMMSAFDRIGETITSEWLKTAGADGEAIIRAYRGR